MSVCPRSIASTPISTPCLPWTQPLSLPLTIPHAGRTYPKRFETPSQIMKPISKGRTFTCCVPALVLLVVAHFSFATVARGDVAVLREKGPKSGSAFANPGVVADPPKDLKVAQRNAEVKIVLRPAGDGNLAADCVATFDLKDISAPASGAIDFLVALPVKGLRSKVATPVWSFRLSL